MRSADVRLIDLTEANPTRVGLTPAGLVDRRALDEAAVAPYAPDPLGSRAAREAVTAYYRTRGCVVRPEGIVLTSSTSEAYAHLFRLLCDPGDQVLVPRPGYPLFEPIAALEAVTVGSYRLVQAAGWALDRDTLRAAIGPRTRAVVVVDPNHPTGSRLDREDRAFLLDLCARRGASVIVDEVFSDYTWRVDGGDEERDAWISSAPVPTFVLNGLSKVCGLPQMKLSWIVVAGPDDQCLEALNGLEWIADLFLSVGAPVQAALPRLLAGRHAFQARVRQRLAVNRARLATAAAGAPRLGVLEAEGGWIAVLRVPETRSEEEWTLELLRRGVVVHPGQFYDFEDEAYLVLSLIVEPEAFDLGVAKIVERVAAGPAPGS